MGTRFKGDTKDPVVNVTTWCLLVVVIFSVLSRLGTKFRLFHKFTTDDFLIVASLAFSIGHSITVSLAVGSGYGKHIRDVSRADSDQIMKEIYAGSLLCILSLLFSKLSLVVFVGKLTPPCEKKRFARGVEGCIYVWATVAFIGSAFPCAAPRIFDIWNGQCLNLLAWRYFIGISNIVTEVLIFTQAMMVIFIIQALERRLIFAGIFVPRILVIFATLFQLVFAKNGTQRVDPSYNMCEITISELIIQCVSILTACWPQLKPFLSWMQSNGLKTHDVEDPNFQSFKVMPLPQARSKSPDFNGHDSLPLTRQDRILTTTDWEVDSQSSQANTIIETDNPLAVESSGGR